MTPMLENETVKTEKTFTMDDMGVAYCLELLVATKDAAYFYIPGPFQRPIANGCICDVCENDQSKATWNILVAPVKRATGRKGYNWTYTVHAPDIHAFIESVNRIKTNKQEAI